MRLPLEQERQSDAGRSFRRWVVLAGLIAVIAHLPGLTVAPWGDELHSLYQAARTFRDPARILVPWMGGGFRVLPKLVMMAGLSLWGLRIWPYHLLCIAIHALSTVLVARLGRRLSGSHRVGAWAALLFAVGFGAYAKPVVVYSNVTMLLGLAFLLSALDLLSSGRWRLALLFFLLGAASHEVVLVAPVLLLVLPPVGWSAGGVSLPRALRRVARGEIPRRAVCVLSLAILAFSFCPGPVGGVCSYEVRMASFAFLPFTMAGIASARDLAGESVASLVSVAVAWRFWIGAAILLVAAYVVWRGRAIHAFSVGWVLLFFLPFWIIAREWEGTWLDRRYLYASSVGLCMLVSLLAFRIAERRRVVRAALFSVLILWSVGVGALWLRGYVQVVQGQEAAAKRAECLRETADLDTRWSGP